MIVRNDEVAATRDETAVVIALNLIGLDS